MRRLSLAGLAFLFTTIASAAVDPTDSLMNLGIVGPIALVARAHVDHPRVLHVGTHCPQRVL